MHFNYVGTLKVFQETGSVRLLENSKDLGSGSKPKVVLLCFIVFFACFYTIFFCFDSSGPVLSGFDTGV